MAKSVEVALSEVDLSPSQYRLLIFLAEAPHAATALADRLSVTRPSLTALVDGLAARGYVVREPDPDDRRKVSHEISDVGRAAIDAADASIQERLTTWVASRLSDDRVAAVNAGLETWHEGMVEARARMVAQ
jgi:long-chain acyl-CoA synthetase